MDDLFVVRVEDGHADGPLEGSRGDVVFPVAVRGWSDVLDCRLHPYSEKTLDDLRHYGVHVNKPYLLVSSSLLEREPIVQAPPVPEPAGDGDGEAR
jgi:hypothetical protein